ncbi:g1 s-specific cyclin-e1 [Stylonychia lemnae]|uniref:G1 s-specific cyclin-e1 n=1 Tax=Stylonychia lemnae TaxID=5949 RepID=A0A078A8G5_STYLE|nr:g1 s-specific cyclin-e1 [Stylonychia lemnae]|eukprot:CDW78519.1 g1 s-specific cyclin-e1 [Stylonychia lemnae]
MKRQHQELNYGSQQNINQNKRRKLACLRVSGLNKQNQLPLSYDLNLRSELDSNNLFPSKQKKISTIFCNQGQQNDKLALYKNDSDFGTYSNTPSSMQTLQQQMNYRDFSYHSSEAGNFESINEDSNNESNLDCSEDIFLVDLENEELSSQKNNHNLAYDKDQKKSINDKHICNNRIGQREGAIAEISNSVCQQIQVPVSIKYLQSEPMLEKHILDNIFASKFLSIKHRISIADWMIQFCTTYKLQKSTFHLGLHYFDQVILKSFQYKESIDQQRLEAYASMSLFIASKINEVSPPSFQLFQLSVKQTNNSQQLRESEIKILQYLDCKLIGATALDMMHQNMIYLNQKQSQQKQITQQEYFIYLDILDLLQLDPYFKSFPPMIMVFTVMQIIKCLLDGNELISKQLQNLIKMEAVDMIKEYQGTNQILITNVSLIETSVHYVLRYKEIINTIVQEYKKNQVLINTNIEGKNEQLIKDKFSQVHSFPSQLKTDFSREIINSMNNQN